MLVPGLFPYLFSAEDVYLTYLGPKCATFLDSEFFEGKRQVATFIT